MRIERVEIRDFRGLVGPLQVDLAPGLNVVHGPNEIGKTTFAEAIWFALAISPRSKAAPIMALRTRGGSDKPTVHLTFARDDRSFEVRKSFGPDGAIQLTERADGRIVAELTGEGAEERLQAVLGVGSSARGALADEARGPFLLSWVRQGDAGSQPGINPPTKASLHEQLAAITGEALHGADGDRILELAEKECLRFYTELGKERTGVGAPLPTAREAATAAAAGLDALRAQVQRHGELVDGLRDIQDKLDAAKAARPSLRDNQAAAQQRYETLKQLADQQEAREQQHAAKARDYARIKAVQDQRGKRAARQRDLAQTTAQLQRDIDGLDEQIRPLRSRRDELQGEAQEHRQRRGELARQRAQAGELVRLAAALRDRAALQQREARVAAAETAAAEAGARCDGNPLTEAALARLQELHQDARDQRMRLNAAAANIRITRHRAVEVRIDGEVVEVPADQALEQTITRSTEIGIGDLVSLSIHPGGTDLGSLEAALRVAESALADALSSHGVDSLDAARAARKDREAAEQTLASSAQTIRELAPDGVDTLRSALRDATARAEQLQQALAAAGVDTAPAQAAATDPDLQPGLDRAVEAAERAADQAREELEGLEERIQSFTADLHRMENERTSKTTDRSNKQEQLTQLAAELATDIADHGDDAQLTTAIGDAARAMESAAAELQELSDRLADDALAGAEQDLHSTQRALQGKDQEIEGLDRDLSERRGQLRATEMTGIHERIAEAEAAAADAERERDRVEAEAAAARLLLETLQRHRDATEQRFRAPLEQDIQRLVRLLWPDATITLDEEFRIVTIERPGRVGRDDFDVLSAGASEQLGLAARLAMARMVARSRPLVVLLDDSLVVTDDDRFRDMARVINRVADDVQIIFLTCHWHRQNQLGLSPHRVVDMAELVRAAAGGGTDPV